MNISYLHKRHIYLIEYTVLTINIVDNLTIKNDNYSATSTSNLFF